MQEEKFIDIQCAHEKETAASVKAVTIKLVNDDNRSKTLEILRCSNFTLVKYISIKPLDRSINNAYGCAVGQMHAANSFQLSIIPDINLYHADSYNTA